MTSEEYWEKVQKNKDSLKSFIACYHPKSGAYNKPNQYTKITAPAAESACNHIRNQIRKEEKESPLIRFNSAIENKDIDVIQSLLQSAWFGVPESTDCWRITGFSEAVDLLEDPPEEAFECTG